MSSGGAEAEAPQYAANESGPVVSKRSYSINFDTGKATFTPEGARTMQELKDSLAITGLFIQVDGYTDNTGSEPINQALSDARAGAVKDWLQKHAPSNFPDNRFKIAGHGSQNPVATNDTIAGKAANRRVEITLLGS
jgi:OmpA-OmpF porin, OOP family